LLSIETHSGYLIYIYVYLALYIFADFNDGEVTHLFPSYYIVNVFCPKDEL